MPLYLVERHIPGISLAGIEAIRSAENRACIAAVAQGRSVRYLRSTFEPVESRCLCLFQAPNADIVQEVNEDAQIPYSRIVLVIDLAAD